VSGAFGLATRARGKGRGSADRTKSAAEGRRKKAYRGITTGGAKSCFAAESVYGGSESRQFWRRETTPVLGMQPSPPGRKLIAKETQFLSRFSHLPCCTTGSKTCTYKVSFLEGDVGERGISDRSRLSWLCNACSVRAAFTPNQGFTPRRSTLFSTRTSLPNDCPQVKKVKGRTSFYFHSRTDSPTMTHGNVVTWLTITPETARTAAPPNLNRVPAPGQVVRLRTRKYLVGAVGKHSNGSGTLVRPSCLDDGATDPRFSGSPSAPATDPAVLLHATSRNFA